MKTNRILEKVIGCGSRTIGWCCDKLQEVHYWRVISWKKKWLIGGI